jgi:hypothetical protein
MFILSRRLREVEKDVSAVEPVIAH